jgi:hypothetical protein
MDAFEKHEISRPCREENRKSSAIQPVPYSFKSEIYRVGVNKKIRSDKSVLIHKPKSVHCCHVAVDASSYKRDHEVAAIHGREGHLFCSRYCSLYPYQNKSESMRIKGNRTAFVETLATDGHFKIFRVKRKKFTLEQATEAQMGTRGINVLFL